MRKVLVALVGAMIVSFTGLAMAQENFPRTDVSIVKPQGTVYVAGFPANVEVELEISAYNNPGNCATDGVAVINVTAQLAGQDPEAPVVTVHNATGISDNPGTKLPNLCNPGATYSFTWSVGQPGTYGLEVMVRRGGVSGTDEEEVEVMFEMVAVENPAPPAVANALIKEFPSVLFSKKHHGCVISKIAEQHAKEEAYGPKGGPYDEDAIWEDVQNFAFDCNNK